MPASRPRLAAALLAVLLLAGAPAFAAPVFPKASRIGLEPPPGFVPSERFVGFENPDQKATMVVGELPGAAYAELDKELSSEALKNNPAGIRVREEIELAGGKKAIYLAGQQDVQGTNVLRFNLIVPAGDLTALITLVMPESAKDAVSEAQVRAAFASLVTREEIPAEEMMALLPFTLADLAGFRIARVQPGAAAMLTEGPRNMLDVNEQPVLVASIGTDAPQPDERANFARRLMGSVPGIKDVKVTRAEPQRISGQQGFEIMVEAKDSRTGAEITAAQWLRFSGGGYLRLVAMTKREQWPEMYNRFRSVRDGLDPK